jgi:hypothetical protein
MSKRSQGLDDAPREAEPGEVARPLVGGGTAILHLPIESFSKLEQVACLGEMGERLGQPNEFAIAPRGTNSGDEQKDN